MVKTKDEILESIKAKIGDDDSDEAIGLLEDITDTLNDYDNKTKDTEDWKAKYEENDKTWRKRYRDRFYNNEGEEDGDNGGIDMKEPLDDNKPHSFDDLFNKGE